MHGLCYPLYKINRIVVEILIVFNSFEIVLIELTFDYFVIYRCMNSTVCDKSIVQFQWDWALPLSQKVQKKKNVLNVAENKKMQFRKIWEI